MPSRTSQKRKSALRQELRRVRASRRAVYAALALAALCVGLLAGFGIGRATVPAESSPAAGAGTSGIAARGDTAAPGISEKLAVLESIFEDGRFWNHTDETSWMDPALSITDTPCAHSADGTDTCNTYKGALLAEFPEFSGIQCFGYASLLSDLLFGTDAPVTAHSDFAKLRAGDTIHFPNAMHSMLVTAVDADAETVTVTEVNADFETCRIAWGRSITRGELYETDSAVIFYTRYEA
ncbi:MAG: hypothetical protein ACLRH1_00085 [Acutalibacteraceae bacterium]